MNTDTVTAKRLRAICQFFKSLNASLTKEQLAAENTNEGKNHLPEVIVAKIREFVGANAAPGDLVAIRNRPGQWDQDCYNWLWILHRYTNRYAD
jgi:hypothetical protein